MKIELTSANSLTKKLGEPVPVPTETVIGQPLSQIVADKTTGLTPKPGEVRGQAVVNYLDASGTLKAQHLPNGDADTFVVVLEKGALIYSDHNRDGKIDSFADTRPSGCSMFGYRAEDMNHDGKLDYLREPVAQIPGFKIEGYDPNWKPPSKPGERILTDTDFDGKFDQETVMAGNQSTFWSKVRR